MGYSLWIADDSHSILGFRMANGPAAEEAQSGEQTDQRSSEGTEPEPIDFAIEKLARPA
jgi:hypothetical protein